MDGIGLMEVAVVAIAWLSGFLVTILGFRHVTSWLFYSWAQFRPEQGKGSVTAFLVAFFLSPGLWTLVALAIASSYFASAWWALWALAGVGCGALYVGWVAVRVIRR